MTGPPIIKSRGVSNSERKLTEICDSTFLKLWTYPNPYKSDGHEMCDLIVVFEQHVFLFFDRHNTSLENYVDGDFLVAWKRWKKATIDKQIKTVIGAERYLRNPKNELFLDAKCTQKFPIHIPREKAIVHKIIVANGATKACLNYSDDNISGSLALSYSRDNDRDSETPFTVKLKNKGIIHVFDDENMKTIFSELDTITDLLAYFEAKEEVIKHTDILSYCAEEDLLARYYLNFDEKEQRHYILPQGEKYNGIMIPEGDWAEFIKSKAYSRKKSADEISYFWDNLIQITSENALKGTTGGDPDIFNRPSAIKEMAKEPRFSRRALSAAIKKSIQNFPSGTGGARNVGLYPSFFSEKRYVFLAVHIPNFEYEEARELKRKMLLIACGAAKLKYPEIKQVVGIAIEAPHLNEKVAEDFILLRDMSQEMIEDVREMNAELQFFETKSLTEERRTTKQFPD